MTSAAALRLLVLAALASAPKGVAQEPALRVVGGVSEVGEPTEQWLGMIRKRLPDDASDVALRQRKPLTPGERAWADLIRSRRAAWELEIPALAEVFWPVHPPPAAAIVLGNRRGSDAFTHDSVTIGFDLAVLDSAYGAADLPENAGRVDRLFRHEYVHLLQKAWLRQHRFAADTPLRAALLEIWAEGLGNYYSMSRRWRAENGSASAAASQALSQLEPRFVARLSALACASAEEAAELTADLSSGRFDRKWGALPAALWLDAEASRSDAALRDFVVGGPQKVWELAERHLADPLRAVLDEARSAAARCAGS